MKRIYHGYREPIRIKPETGTVQRFLDKIIGRSGSWVFFTEDMSHHLLPEFIHMTETEDEMFSRPDFQLMYGEEDEVT